MSTDLEVEMFVRYQSQLFDCMQSMYTDPEVGLFLDTICSYMVPCMRRIPILK